MIRYVVGFLFSEDRQKVLLIEKLKPDWQKGLLNGVGGKIEKFESSLDAMIREFNEEAGLNIETWKLGVKLTGMDSSFNVDFYYAFDNKIYEAKALTKEQLVMVNTFNLPDNVIFNLHWLIPFCLDNTLIKPISIFGK